MGVGYYTDISDDNVEGKLEGSSGVSGKVATGARVVMDAGMIEMGKDAV